jgi:predicted CXXCH cytochrome family protein
MAQRRSDTRKAGSATALLLGVAATLLAGCDATTRHKVLTYFFDGVPPLQEAGAPATAAGAPGLQAPVRPVLQAHGPYAAKLCEACHSESMGNTLVAPRDQLCQRCHELPMDKKYVHGPLASGDCLVCHDPHSSPYRPLLVSEAQDFCFSCHAREAVAAVPGHEGIEEGCTDCHDAHMSDTKNLLK